MAAIDIKPAAQLERTAREQANSHDPEYVSVVEWGCGRRIETRQRSFLDPGCISNSATQTRNIFGP